MNHLFVVRHASYGYDSRINQVGRKEMEVLGNFIREIVNGDSMHIVTSTAPRAIDSSAVLKDNLGITYEPKKIPYLWSGEDAPTDTYQNDPNLEKIMNIVDENKKFDTLIMISHLEVTADFPKYFLFKEFGKKEYIRGIRRGNAIHFDLLKRTYQILP